MTDRLERRHRWLRLCALAIRITVAVVALGSGILGGIVAANILGRESPFVWTAAIFIGFAVGVFLMSNRAIHRLANRLDHAASEGEEPPERDKR